MDEQRTPTTVAFTVPGTAKDNATFYFNGVTRAYRSSVTSSTITSDSRRVGLVQTTGTRPYNVIYRAVRLYNRVLSADEVAFNAAIDRVRFEGKDWPDGYRYNETTGRCEVRIALAANGNGEVAVNGGAAGATNSIWVTSGTETTLTFSATPEASNSFAAWTGFPLMTAAQRVSASAAVTFTPLAPATLTANFIVNGSGRWLYSPAAGTITLGPAVLRCAAAAGVDCGLNLSGVTSAGDGIINLRLPVIDPDTGFFYHVKSIAAVFQSNLGVTELHIPDSVASIAANACKGATNLVQVTLPSGLVSIGASAFQNCYSLASFSPQFPDSVTNVGASAFSGCAKLEGVARLHGAITIGKDIIASTKIGEFDIEGAPLTTFGAGAYASVTNFHPLLPATLNGPTPPTWNSWKLGGKPRLCLCSPKFTSLTGDNFRYMPWSEVDMTGSSITTSGYWSFYGCSSLTNVVFPVTYTTFPNVSQIFGGCGQLRWVRFRGDPPVVIITNPFGGHAGMCYYLPKWNERWEAYLAAQEECEVSEMTSAECENFRAAHPGEPMPVQRLSMGGGGTKAVSTTKGFLWWYPDAPPVYKELSLFDLLRYEETSAAVTGGYGIYGTNIFDGTTYTYNTTAAHANLRWLAENGASAEIAVPANAVVSRAMMLTGYRLHQLCISSYANSRAPTAWTLYGRTEDGGDWVEIDSVTMTASSANRWAYFDDPETYPVAGTTQKTPPRARCALTYEVPAAKRVRYVAYKFTPTNSYNLENAVQDSFPFGVMELELLGELTTSEPHIGAFAVTRTGWTDLDFAFDLDSIGDTDMHGRTPHSAVAWVEVANDGEFTNVVSRSAVAAVAAGTGIAATAGGLAGNTSYAARLVVSNDLGLAVVMALDGGAGTLAAPFEINSVSVATNSAGGLSAAIDVNALYAGPVTVTVSYRATPAAAPVTLGSVTVASTGATSLDSVTSGTVPEATSVVDVLVEGDGSSQAFAMTPFGFWLANSNTSPTQISNTVTRTTFAVNSAAAGLTLSSLKDLGDTFAVDLTAPILSPDGAALSLVSPGAVFRGNLHVEEVLLPDSVTTVPDNAFNQCAALKRFRFSRSITRIGTAAFNSCANMKEVENLFPTGCTYIGGSAFNTCSKLPNFRLAEGLRDIYGSTFSGCSSITELHIPDSVTNIAYGAFVGANSLTNVTPRYLPPQIRTATLNAFHDRNNVKGPLILDNPEMRAIDPDGFRYNYGITEVDMLGSSITSIGTLAFYSCNSLAKVRFPMTQVTCAKTTQATFTSPVLREVIFPGPPPVITHNIFSSSYYIIKAPLDRDDWQELLAEALANGWLTEMTAADRVTFRQRYPGYKRVPRYWLNLRGYTGKRYLLSLGEPGFTVIIK
ncbi:MAG: leucine-rich repeat protein [Kiritimatiellae bacterium]|nr:leucine-rich repeat protein [Kiritimatiellia bacterium]